MPGATQAANAIDRDFVVGDEPLLSFVAWKQFPPPRRQVPVLRVAEPHLRLHALGVPIGPHSATASDVARSTSRPASVPMCCKSES